MTIEEDLKLLIKSKYKSLRAFTLDNNLNYGSVDNIFKRSLYSASFQLVSQICTALDLDLNSLANDNKLISIHDVKNNDVIVDNFINIKDESEVELLNNYRFLNLEGQFSLLEASREKLEVSKYKKRDIYNGLQKQA